MIKYKKNNYYKLTILLLIIFFLTFSLLKNYVPLVKINYYLSYPYLFIKNTCDNFKSSKTLNKENKLLKEEINNLNIIKQQNNSLLSNINELKNLLELKNIYSSYNIINATVIEKNKLYYFNNYTLDKGHDYNIKENMAIVNKDGLVGIIDKVYENYSTFKLLTTLNDNKISVKIKNNNTQFYGTITSYKDNLFILEGITNYQDIALNSDVLTTGYGIFPSDLLIGKVIKIEDNKYNTSKLLYVESNVNFNELYYVSILGNDL